MLELTTGPASGRTRPVERFNKPPACCCRYDLRKVAGAPATHQLDPFGKFTRGWGCWAFRIDPNCPHHGDHR